MSLYEQYKDRKEEYEGFEQFSHPEYLKICQWLEEHGDEANINIPANDPRNYVGVEVQRRGNRKVSKRGK